MLCFLLIICSCAVGVTNNKNNTALSSGEDISVQDSTFGSIPEDSGSESVTPEIEIKNYVEEWGNIRNNYNGLCEALTTDNTESKNIEDIPIERFYVDYTNLMDNETALSELLKRHKKLSADETLLLLNIPTYTYAPDAMGYIIHTTINLTIPAVGQNIEFIRTTNDFINSDSRWNSNGKRCYTVFESELGGYVYIFFDLYPDDVGMNTKLRRVLYYNYDYTTIDISSIQNSGSIKQFIELYPEFKSLDQIENEEAVVNISILLKDGVFIAGTNKAAEGEFVSSFLFEGNIVPPDNGRKNEADNLDVTILPQDYPPAS